MEVARRHGRRADRPAPARLHGRWRDVGPRGSRARLRGIPRARPRPARLRRRRARAARRLLLLPRLRARRGRAGRRARPAGGAVDGGGPLDGRHRRHAVHRARSRGACRASWWPRGWGRPTASTSTCPIAWGTGSTGVRRVRGKGERTMASLDEALDRLANNHPRVPRDVLRTRASALARQLSDGRVAWKADPLHATRSPVALLRGDVQGLRPARRVPRRSTFPVGRSGWHPPDEEERLACFRTLSRARDRRRGSHDALDAPRAARREPSLEFGVGAGPAGSVTEAGVGRAAGSGVARGWDGAALATVARLTVGDGRDAEAALAGRRGVAHRGWRSSAEAGAHRHRDGAARSRPTQYAPEDRLIAVGTPAVRVAVGPHSAGLRCTCPWRRRPGSGFAGAPRRSAGAAGAACGSDRNGCGTRTARAHEVAVAVVGRRARGPRVAQLHAVAALAAGGDAAVARPALRVVEARAVGDGARGPARGGLRACRRRSRCTRACRARRRRPRARRPSSRCPWRPRWHCSRAAAASRTSACRHTGPGEGTASRSRACCSTPDRCRCRPGSATCPPLRVSAFAAAASATLTGGAVDGGVVTPVAVGRPVRHAAGARAGEGDEAGGRGSREEGKQSQERTVQAAMKTATKPRCRPIRS